MFLIHDQVGTRIDPDPFDGCDFDPDISVFDHSDHEEHDIGQTPELSVEEKEDVVVTPPSQIVFSHRY